MIELWWKTDDTENVHVLLVPHVEAIANLQRARVSAMRRSVEAFEGYNTSTPGFLLVEEQQTGRRAWLNLNVTASIIRTLRAEVTVDQPRPWIQTDGGSMALQIKCEGLQQFVDGVLYETDAYKTAERWFDHAAVCGAGWIGVVEDTANECVAIDLWHPWEVVLDEEDSKYGHPQEIHRVRYLDRQLVLAMFPDRESDVAACGAASMADTYYQAVRPNPRLDQVRVIESWKRPTTVRSNDGRHAIVIDNATLWQEPWDADLPVVPFSVEPRITGLRGLSIVEELAPIQAQIDDLLNQIKEGHDYGGHVIVIVPKGSGISKDQITNEMHSVLEANLAGGEVKPIVVPTVSADKYSFLWELFAKAYEIIGVSMMGAQAQAPAGITAAVAMRTLRRLQSKRFSYVVREYGRGIRRVAELAIEAARRLSDSVPGFSVRYSSSDAIKRIKWRDVDMDRDAFSVQMFDTAMTSRDPEGRMQEIQEKLQMGVLDPREAAMYLDDPDLRSRPDPWIASYKLARWQIHRILREGAEDVFVETFQDFSVAFRLGVAEYCRAQLWEDVPPERLERLRAYIEDAQARQAELSAPPAAPATAPEQTPEQAPVAPERAVA